MIASPWPSWSSRSMPKWRELIRDPQTTVRRLNTPFLIDGLIFQVDWHGPYTAGHADYWLCKAGQLLPCCCR